MTPEELNQCVQETGEFTYRGSVYVRPVERGVVLKDIEGDLAVYLDNAAALVGTGSMFGDGYANLEIIIRRIES